MHRLILAAGAVLGVLVLGACDDGGDQTGEQPAGVEPGATQTGEQPTGMQPPAGEQPTDMQPGGGAQPQ